MILFNRLTFKYGLSNVPIIFRPTRFVDVLFFCTGTHFVYMMLLCGSIRDILYAHMCLKKHFSQQLVFGLNQQFHDLSAFATSMSKLAPQSLSNVQALMFLFFSNSGYELAIKNALIYICKNYIPT